MPGHRVGRLYHILTKTLELYSRAILKSLYVSSRTYMAHMLRVLSRDDKANDTG